MAVQIDDSGTARKAVEFLIQVGKLSVDEADRLLEQQLKVAEAEAKRVVPVRTGFLQSSVFWLRQAKAVFIFGAKAPYAVFVEYGTSRMNARPFLRPALWQAFPDLKSQYKQRLAATLNRIKP